MVVSMKFRRFIRGLDYLKHKIVQTWEFPWLWRIGLDWICVTTTHVFQDIMPGQMSIKHYTCVTSLYLQSMSVMHKTICAITYRVFAWLLIHDLNAISTILVFCTVALQSFSNISMAQCKIAIFTNFDVLESDQSPTDMETCQGYVLLRKSISKPI